MPLWTYQLQECALPARQAAVSDAELAMALGRTVLGYAASLPARQRFADLAQQAMDLMINPAPGDLELIPNYKQVFRDFSGTSRVGELGQALVYHHFATTSPYTQVVDYAGWLQTMGIAVAGRSTPDFILLDASSPGRLTALVEAKGSATRSTKSSALAKGQQQCRLGQTFLSSQTPPLPVRNLYACFSYFHIHGSAGGPSELTIRDPEKKVPTPHREVFTKLLHYSYRSYAHLLGYGEAFSPHTFLKPVRRKTRLNGLPTLLEIPLGRESPLHRQTADGQASRWNDYCFCIQEDVAQLLADERRFESVRWPTLEIRRAARERGITIYGDGTAFMPKAQ